MSTKIEMKAGISAVEVIREKIKNTKTIEEAIQIIDQDLETAKLSLDYEKIDVKDANFYETVTVKIPKAVMDLLRASQPITGDTPNQDIEYHAVESVRARIDSGQFLPTGKDLADQYNLNPVFEAILNDPVK